MNMRTKGLHRALVPSLAAIALMGLANGAAAQLTSQQQSALRSNCRSDFMSHCSGVTPGSKEALACLQKNVAGLSAGCQAAVRPTMPAPVQAAPAPAAPKPHVAAPAPAPVAAPATAAEPAMPSVTTAPPPKAEKPKRVAKPAAPAAAKPKPPTAAQQEAMRENCRNDFMSHCSGVTPGSKDALACLQKNVAGLSSTCKSVVSATMHAPAAAKPKASAAHPAAARAVVPAAPAPAVVVVPVEGPTPEQMSALKFTCRADFNRHCAGIPPGGPEALACLERNAARLTPNCKTAFDDIADSLPPMPAAMPGPAAPPHTVVSIVPGGVLIEKACARYMIMHCPGMGLDMGRKVACLVDYAKSGKFIGPRCKTVLKVTGHLK